MNTLLHMVIDCRIEMRAIHCRQKRQIIFHILRYNQSDSKTSLNFHPLIPCCPYRSLGLQKHWNGEVFQSLSWYNTSPKLAVLGDLYYIYFHCSSTSAFACRKWPRALSPLAHTTSRLYSRKSLKSSPMCFCNFVSQMLWVLQSTLRSGLDQGSTVVRTTTWHRHLSIVLVFDQYGGKTRCP
jgi:hypothetical protein